MKKVSYPGDELSQSFSVFNINFPGSFYLAES